jgi:hypothetical protein
MRQSFARPVAVALALSMWFVFVGNDPSLAETCSKVSKRALYYAHTEVPANPPAANFEQAYRQGLYQVNNSPTDSFTIPGNKFSVSADEARAYLDSKYARDKASFDSAMASYNQQVANWKKIVRKASPACKKYAATL